MPEEEQLSEQTVIVAVDFTDESERAVKYYVDKFHRPGNRVLLLHCTDLPRKNALVERTEEGDESKDSLTDLWDEEETNLKILESKLTFLFMSHEVPATLYTVVGKPSSMIWRVADTESATLIVLGSRRAHGKKSPFRSVIGSMAGLSDGVTDSVLKNASCPVVVCRSPQDERRFSLFQGGERKFSLMPTPRQRCQSTSEVEMKKSGRKQRHSSGGESIASRIKRRPASFKLGRFSSGGHRLMSMPTGLPLSPVVSGNLDEHSAEGDDCAFQPIANGERLAGDTGERSSEEQSKSKAPVKSQKSIDRGKKSSVTFEVKADVMSGGRALAEVNEDDDSLNQESKISEMKALQTNSSAVAAAAKA